MPKFSLKQLGVLAIFCAVIMFGVSGYLACQTGAFLKDGVAVDARVIGLIQKSDGEHGSLFFPVYSFRDLRGQEQVVYSQTGTSPAASSVGETVKIIYLPQEPMNIRVDNNDELWRVPIMLLVMGWCDFAIGLGLIFVPTLYGKYRARKQGRSE